MKHKVGFLIQHFRVACLFLSTRFTIGFTGGGLVCLVGPHLCKELLSLIFQHCSMLHSVVVKNLKLHLST